LLSGQYIDHFILVFDWASENTVRGGKWVGSGHIWVNPCILDPYLTCGLMGQLVGCSLEVFFGSNLYYAIFKEEIFSKMHCSELSYMKKSYMFIRII